MTRAGRWFARITAVVALVTLGLGSLFLASWFRDRRETARETVATHEPVHAGTPVVAVPIDPRMQAYLAHSIAFNPVREVRFGKDRALFCAGPSRRRPEDVFGGILKTWEPQLDPVAIRAALINDLTATALLRLHVTTGMFPGGAFLVRLAPDPTSYASGHLRLEPGGAMLAWDEGDSWQYAVFYFPHGIDIEAFTEQNAPPPNALAALGPEASRSLVPAMVLGDPDRETGASTVLCVSKGLAGAAVDRVADAMTRAGFRDVTAGPSVEAGEEIVRVLRGPTSTVWLSTTDPAHDGGLVTVTIGTM